MLKKEAASRVVSDAQLADYQETFNLFDSRGDGKIHCFQIGEVLRAMGQNPTEAEVKKCYDTNNPEERIGFEVFYPIYQMISKNQIVASKDDFIEGFRVFDKDQSGVIGSAELRHLLTSLGEKLTDEEVEALLQGQEDAQGNVNYEEFVKAIMSG